jgi:hypothetical protein
MLWRRLDFRRLIFPWRKGEIRQGKSPLRNRVLIALVFRKQIKNDQGPAQVPDYRATGGGFGVGGEAEFLSRPNAFLEPASMSRPSFVQSP